VIMLLSVVEIVLSVGSGTVTLVVSLVVLVTELGVMTVVTETDPLCTPTTLTLDVSTMFNRAHKLLMKLVMLLLLRKNSLMFIAK